MDGLSFARSTSGKEKIWHHGTYNANPLSAAAGIATLQIVATSDACQRANDYAARLRAALRDVLDEEGVAGVVYGTYSGFHILLDPSDSTMTAETIEAGRYDYQALKLRRNPQLTHLLRLGMLVHGVDIFGWPGGPTSAVHTDADLARTADAFRCTLQMLKAEGALNGLRKPAPALA
jgi:glutamate-1-semialdehyde 2,1-aminomutase